MVVGSLSYYFYSRLKNKKWWWINKRWLM
jgi:hypothetical protein